MKFMTFSQKKLARSNYFISEAQARYVRTVDEIIQLNERIKKLRQKANHYEHVFNTLLNEFDMNCERFSKSRGSRYEEEFKAQNNLDNFSYDLIKK